jgi:hypothetical protein
VAEKGEASEVKVIEAEIINDKQELADQLRRVENDNKTCEELVKTQRETITLLTNEFIKASNLLNKCLSIIQADGFKVRNAGANLEKFMNDNQDQFIKLILMGRQMAGNPLEKSKVEN